MLEFSFTGEDTGSMIEINQFEEIIQIRMSRELGGKPRYWVAAYLVDGLLIDTGCKHTADELLKFLEDQSVKLVVNTHYHEDHIGANHLLKQNSDIEIFAHRESVPLINHVPKLYPYQEMVWGYPEPTEVDCLSDKLKTDRLHFEVVETPGHCSGHIALVEPEKGWCFSGDLFVSERPPVVRPEENITEIIRSMKKLIDLKTDRLILFTSIGNVVQDGRRALQSCIDYFRDLSQRAKQLDKKGLSIEAIRDRLFERESHLARLTDGQFSSENLVRAVLQS